MSVGPICDVEALSSLAGMYVNQVRAGMQQL